MADEDIVRPVLDPLPVDPAVKRAAWDGFYQSSSPEDFKSRFDALEIPREAKRALWDLKFRPAGVTPNAAPTGPTGPVTQDTAQAQFSGPLANPQDPSSRLPSASEAQQLATKEAKDKIDALVAQARQGQLPGTEQTGLPGVPQPPTPLALQGDKQQTASVNEAIAAAPRQLNAEATPGQPTMADIENLGLATGVEGLGEAALKASSPIARRALAGLANAAGLYFRYGLGKDSLERARQGAEAFKKGDYLDSLRHLTAAGVEGGLAVAGAGRQLKSAAVFDPNYRAAQEAKPPSEQDLGVRGKGGPLEPEVLPPEAASPKTTERAALNPETPAVEVPPAPAPKPKRAKVRKAAETPATVPSPEVQQAPGEAVMRETVAENTSAPAESPKPAIAADLVEHYTKNGMQPAPGTTATPEEIQAGAELAIERHNAENPEIQKAGKQESQPEAPAGESPPAGGPVDRATDGEVVSAAAAPDLPTGKRGAESGSASKEVAAPKPGTVAELPVKSIRVDPARFQFKANTGQGGAGEELRQVETFDPEKSGVIAVWHDPADGQTYVVNGHHRLELAQRTGTEAITARYLRADNAQEARAKGALINIAEGRGESTDAAKVFRDMGLDAEGLREQGVSLKGKVASEGLALSKLDPHLFSKVIAGEIPAARAAIIGAGLPEHADQRELYDVIKKADKAGKRPTNDQIGEMIRLATAGPKKTETRGGAQGGLFGEEAVTRSLIKEKAEVSDYIRKQLASDKKLFGLAGKESAAAKLGERGNVIKAAENQAVAAETSQALEIYDKLSTRSGPVSQALESAASALAEGNDATKTKQSAYLKVRQALVHEVNQLSGVPQGDVRGAQGLGEKGPLQNGQGKPGPTSGEGSVSPLFSHIRIGKPGEELAEPSARVVRINGRPVLFANRRGFHIIAGEHAGGTVLDGVAQEHLLQRMEAGRRLYGESLHHRQVRDVIFQARRMQRQGAPLAVVSAGPDRSRGEVRGALREELDHIKQVEATGPIYARHLGPLGEAALLDTEAGKKAIEALAAANYDSSSRPVMALEIGVRLMQPGRYAELGLTGNEAEQLALTYVHELANLHGKEKVASIVDQVYSAFGEQLQGKNKEGQPALEFGRPVGKAGATAAARNPARAGRRSVSQGVPGNAEQGSLFNSGKVTPQSDLFGDTFDTEAQREAEASGQRKLEGDRLTAEFSTQMAARAKGLKKPKNKQTSLFEPNPEEEQGLLFQRRKLSRQERLRTQGSLEILPQDYSSDQDEALKARLKAAGEILMHSDVSLAGSNYFAAFGSTGEIVGQVSKEDYLAWERRVFPESAGADVSSKYFYRVEFPNGALEPYATKKASHAVNGQGKPGQGVLFSRRESERGSFSFRPKSPKPAMGAPVDKKQLREIGKASRKYDITATDVAKLAKQISGQPDITKLSSAHAAELVALMGAKLPSGNRFYSASVNPWSHYVESPSRVLGRSLYGARIYREAEHQFFEQQRMSRRFVSNYHKATKRLNQAEKNEIARFRLRIDDKGQRVDVPPALPEKLARVNNQLTKFVYEPMFQIGVKKGLVSERQHFDDYLPYYRENTAKFPGTAKADMAANIAQELGISVSAAEQIMEEADTRNVNFGPFDYSRLAKSVPELRKLDKITEIYVKGFARKVAVTDFLAVANPLRLKIKDEGMRQYARLYIDQYAGKPQYSAADDWLERQKMRVPGLRNINLSTARLAGVATAVQFQAKLGFNLFSPILNLTQTLVNTVPAFGAIRTFGVLGRGAAPILLPDKLNPFVHDLAKLNRSGVLDSQSVKFEQTNLSGYWGKAQEAMSYLFNKSEQFNRSSAFLAGYEQAKASGLSEHASILKGREAVRVTQFFSGRLDGPLFSRTPVGRVMMQFKTFTAKEIEFVTKLSRGQKLKFAVMSVALGGVAALGLLQAFKAFFPDSDVTHMLEQWQETYNVAAFLQADHLAKQFGIYNVPGLETFGHKDTKATLLEWAAGPTLNAILDMATAATKDRDKATKLVTAAIRGFAPGGVEIMRLKRAMEGADSPEEALRTLVGFGRSQPSRGSGRRDPELDRLLGR